MTNQSSPTQITADARNASYFYDILGTTVNNNSIIIIVIIIMLVVVVM